MIRDLKVLLHALRGQPDARLRHARMLAAAPDAMSGLAALLERFDAEHDDEPAAPSPVFVFSAGWRSGSTFLQRLILADSDILLWGEPYDRSNLVPALMSTLPAIQADWPPDEFFMSGGNDRALADEWVANLYPPAADLRRAHRALFRTLFEAPALAAGAKRWGFKEVRLDINAARYLRWLFPDARFVFLYRNPYDAYRSYRKRGARWYLHWPDRPVFTPGAFGSHWARLVHGFQSGVAEVDGHLVQYEALAAQPAVADALTAYVGSNPDPHAMEAVRARQVGSSHSAAGGRLWLPVVDRWLLSRAVEPLAGELGYRP